MNQREIQGQGKAVFQATYRSLVASQRTGLGAPWELAVAMAFLSTSPDAPPGGMPFGSGSIDADRRGRDGCRG